VATNVTYSATLPFSQDGVLFVSGLLRAERLRRGTRTGSRALGCFKQPVMILRWFLDGTRVAQLPADNTIGRSTAYSYLHEGIDVLAAKAPGLHGALLAAKAAGCDHVIVDGTLIATDRCRTPGPTPGVDLWWSGKHSHHGGNVQVITAPDGWPLWTSPVRPGREYDTTALRTHAEILPALTIWTADDRPVLGDLGYEGEAEVITIAFKTPTGGELTDEQKTYNKQHNSKRRSRLRLRQGRAVGPRPVAQRSGGRPRPAQERDGRAERRRRQGEGCQGPRRDVGAGRRLPPDPGRRRRRPAGTDRPG
jgi:hypothetical protein